MGHLMFDELQSAFWAEAAGPQRVAGVSMRPKLTTLSMAWSAVHSSSNQVL
jgi:hypothetical protein